MTFTVEDYKNLLRRHYINPDRKYRLVITVTELELNALEDLLHAELEPEVKKVLEDIVHKFWLRLVRRICKSNR